MPRFKETCSCGASYEIWSLGMPTIEAIMEWRENHNHTPPKPPHPNQGDK